MEKYFVKSVGTLLLVCIRIVFSFPLLTFQRQPLPLCCLSRKLIIEETPSGHVKVNAIAGSNKKRKKVEAPVDEESSSESSEGEDSDTTDESEEEAGEQLKAMEEEQSDSDNEDEPPKQVGGLLNDTVREVVRDGNELTRAVLCML